MHETPSTIRSVLHSSKINIIKAILLKNVEVTDQIDIYQTSIRFFIGIATEVEAGIPASITDPLSFVSPVTAYIILYPVPVEEYLNVI